MTGLSEEQRTELDDKRIARGLPPKFRADPVGPKPKPENIPLTLDDWLARDLPEPDFIMGQWLSTTSRVLMVARTGLGKTLLSLALSFHAAAGANFLHWSAQRPARILYVDGEMPRRLLKQRLAEEAARFGGKPKGFHALSREDIEGFAPLNTEAGQACIDRIIEQVGTITDKAQHRAGMASPYRP
jgi:RecA-family ATPase